MNKFFKAVAIAAVALSASFAHASVVTFSASPSISFADGTFSHNLTNDADGFYSRGDNTLAYNGYGVSGEYISFTTAKHLDSLNLTNYSGLTGVRVDLFDSLNNLIAQQTNTFGVSKSLMTFNTNDVSKIVFNNMSGSNANAHGWYYLSAVTYSANARAVPEPATLAIFGIALAGFGAARGRRK